MPLPSSLSASLTAVQAAITAVGQLQTATLAALWPVRVAVESAIATFDAEIAVLSTRVETYTAQLADGAAVPDLLTSFALDFEAVQNLNTALTARWYLARMLANLKVTTG